MTLSVLSCKKDDNGPAEFVLNNENLSGTYELVFYKEIRVETTNVNGFDVVSVISEIGDTFEVDYTFTPNGRYSASGLFRIVTTTVVNGMLTMEDAFIETVAIQDRSYSITSSTSILVLDGDTYEVELFNETQLRVKLNEMQTFPNGDTVDFSVELHLVRK
jgi:hypothetical protein